MVLWSCSTDIGIEIDPQYFGIDSSLMITFRFEGYFATWLIQNTQNSKQNACYSVHPANQKLFYYYYIGIIII